MQFRDEYSVFTSAGAEVVGISSDKPDALAEFVKSQRLNFPLLSDEGSKLRKGLKVKGVFCHLCNLLYAYSSRRGSSSRLRPNQRMTEAKPQPSHLRVQ